MMNGLETVERTGGRAGGRAGGSTVEDAEILTGSNQDGEDLEMSRTKGQLKLSGLKIN